MNTQLYSFDRNFPVPLPDRIRLSSGATRTDRSTFTEEEILDAGYILTNPMPAHNPATQRVTWNGSEWLVRDLTADEVSTLASDEFENVRQKRNKLINDVMWRVERYYSEVRLGLTPTDDIVKLDTYIQSLRDITKQAGPYNIIWPTLS